MKAESFMKDPDILEDGVFSQWELMHQYERELRIAANQKLRDDLLALFGEEVQICSELRSEQIKRRWRTDVPASQEQIRQANEFFQAQIQHQER